MSTPKKKADNELTRSSQDVLTTSLQAVKENPNLLTQWAQKNPWQATTITGLAIGGYLSYSQHIGEYKIPSLTFKLSEQSSLSVAGALEQEGKVKNVGVIFQWKF